MDAPEVTVAAAQARVDDARKLLRTREEEVQAARAALPPPVDIVLQDPPLAAAWGDVSEEDKVKQARIDELPALIADARAMWNREGLRVIASQRTGSPDMAVLDEDERFLAATEFYEALIVEHNTLRRSVMFEANMRLFNASVKRHDDAIAARESRLLAAPAETRGLRAEIARRLKELA